MCHPDLTLKTYFWMYDVLEAQPVEFPLRECINWNSIQAWSVDRMYDLGSGGLVNPQLGPSSPVSERLAVLMYVV